MISKLLRKNTSPARIAGFTLSNFIGLAIVLVALQFYRDAGSIWSDDDSFIRSDLLVVNKKVTSSNTLGGSSAFTESEEADIAAQPWSRRTGAFTVSDYRVLASVQSGGRGMSTYMFFEAIPDEFVDVPRSQWTWRPGSDEVPIILSKDYLTLYNFGFASSAGLPQMSEGLMSSIPLTLTLTSDDGTRRRVMHGRVAGFSNRLNTILVPQAFIDETNAELGTGAARRPSRLAIDVSSPGDVAITKYLDAHDLEVAGDKSASSASFLLRVVTGVVLSVGGIITLLSLFILMLSISLIMEKNRATLHQLLMLGYPARDIARPYISLAVWASTAAYGLAVAAAFALRAYYLHAIEGLGAAPPSPWLMPVVGAALTALIIALNIIAIRRRVASAFF